MMGNIVGKNGGTDSLRFRMHSLPFFLSRGAVPLFAVETAVDLLLRVCEVEDVIQLLLDGGDAARIFAFDDIDQSLGQLDPFLFDDFSILYDVDRDLVVDVAEHVQIQIVNRAFDFDDVFFPHFVAVRVFDDRDAAVHAVELQVPIKVHTFAGLDVVKHHAFV